MRSTVQPAARRAATNGANASKNIAGATTASSAPRVAHSDDGWLAVTASALDTLAPVKASTRCAAPPAAIVTSAVNVPSPAAVTATGSSTGAAGSARSTTRTSADEKPARLALAPAGTLATSVSPVA